MAVLNFETGIETYTINDACEIRFNPTDAAFLQGIFDAFDALEKRQKEYQDLAATLNDPRDIFEFARERDAEMREILDGALGAPVCGAVFGGMNVYALAGGLPVWCNLLLAVMDEINDAQLRQQKQSNPRIRKYLEKYRK